MAINYIIFPMLTSSANEVWCICVITHHYTRWILHFGIRSCSHFLFPALGSYVFSKRSFNGAKNNYFEVKLAVYHLSRLRLWNYDLFHVHTVPWVQLCTSTFFSGKQPNFNLLNLSISVTMGCHSSWQDTCLLYQGAQSNLIQDAFITKPQDPDQRVVMAVLRQKVDQLQIYQPNKNRQEHFLSSVYLISYRHQGYTQGYTQITHFKVRCLQRPNNLHFSN